MTSPRKPGFVLPVAVTLAVLLGLYGGAYYAMVRPFPLGLAGIIPLYSPGLIEELDIDRERMLGLFFTPAHSLDRRIRPHVWEPSE